jgi:TFIIH basal transcription factor complex TTD-A subunit
MPNVSKGHLVKCDPAMKQFLLHLDETLAFGRKFVLHNLDDTHLFIQSDIVDLLKAKIDELMDKMSVPMVD